MQLHYHVRTNTDNEDAFIATDIYSALDAAADELRDLAEMEFEAIAASGDAEMYETAYRAFTRWQALGILRDSVLNVVRQHNTSERLDRAPLFRNWHIDQRRGDYGDDSKLLASALWVTDMVNQSTTTRMLEIVVCSATDVIADEDGVWHESYDPAG